MSLKEWYKAGFISREVALYKLLLRKNVKVSFLTYGNSYDYDYKDIINNIKIIPCLKYVKSNNRFISFLKSFILPIKLKNEIKKFDIIKTNQLEGSWVAWIAKLLYRKKLIIRGGFEWLRNYTAAYQLTNKKHYLKHLFQVVKIHILEYIAYKMADAIILTSDLDVDFVIKRFKLKRKKEKINHFYNYINTNLFKPIDIGKKDKHVLYIGKLYEAKNLINLLKAFKELQGFTLDIVGAGSYESRLKKLANELKININFYGIINNEDLPKLINQYNIFIQPSYYEGNPKSLLEAMSCGIPCIGTNVRGIKNLIKHKENGYLCETNSESLGQAIISLYNDEELKKKIGRKAREFVLNNCSINKIIDKEYNLYKSLFQ